MSDPAGAWTSEGFDHHDPEIEALMRQKSRAQTERAAEADDRYHPLIQQFATINLGLIEAFDAFVQTAERFSVAMQESGWKFPVTFRFDPPDPPTGPPSTIMLRKTRVLPGTQKLRHGHAAICPRHGPVSGGLCRRCQR